MKIIGDKKISFVQGDDFVRRFTISIEQKAASLTTDKIIEQVILSCKDLGFYQTLSKIEDTEGEYLFRLTPEYTSKMCCGNFIYDLRIDFCDKRNRFTKTVIYNSIIRVLPNTSGLTPKDDETENCC